MLEGLLDKLTPREKEVLSLLEEGLSNAEIGKRLGCVEATVRSHVTRIYSKLEVRNRREAIYLFFEERDRKVKLADEEFKNRVREFEIAITELRFYSRKIAGLLEKLRVK